MKEDALEVLTAWTQALLVERDEERARLQSVLEHASLKQRRAEGLSWSPVAVVAASYAFGGAQWSLTCGEGGGMSNAFRVGSAVLLSPVGDDEASKALGVWPARVRKMRGLDMEVVLEGEGPEGVSPQHLKWTVDARADERSYNAMAHALSHWVNADADTDKSFRDLALGVAEHWPEPHPDDAVIGEASGLNEGQRLAAQDIWRRPQVSLLHGPPGTGKTSTLVAAVKDLVAAGDKVLAAGPSNMAVDVLVERFHQAGMNVVRVGHPMRVQQGVLERTLDARVQDLPEYARVVKTRRDAAQQQRDADRHVRNYDAAQREARRQARAEARALRKEAEELEAYLAEKVIREADVVCATLVGCDDRRLRGVTFDVAVVDEAAQALPPATLIPMRRATRLVLSGDPCQLPPTVKSQGAHVLATTMMERLVERHPDQTHLLQVQHRMHEAIMAFGNMKFYGGQLKAHPDVAARTLEGLKPWVVVDTAGCGFDEVRSQEGGSVSNPDEASFVLDRAAEWLNLHPGMSLGIVAPYAAQVETLREGWSERVRAQQGLRQAAVTIHTVDGFQGQERDAMLVSLTRSNDKGEVGFLSESRRIHVAQTRAKMACMLVGDSATLSTDAFLAELFEHAQAHDAYDSAWSWMV